MSVSSTGMNRRLTDGMRRIHRVHFVGIGGSGMGGITGCRPWPASRSGTAPSWG